MKRFTDRERELLADVRAEMETLQRLRTELESVSEQMVPLLGLLISMSGTMQSSIGRAERLMRQAVQTCARCADENCPLKVADDSPSFQTVLVPPETPPKTD